VEKMGEVAAFPSECEQNLIEIESLQKSYGQRSRDEPVKASSFRCGLQS
jgi:hypothetical protein